MNDPTNHLEKLHKAFESGALDEDTYRKAVADAASAKPAGDKAAFPGVSAGAGSAAIGRDVHGDVVIAGQGATIVFGEQPIAMTAVERESALGRYLSHVISRTRYLQLQGIRSGGKLVNIELEHIYITLHTDARAAALPEEELSAGNADPSPGELRERCDDYKVPSSAIKVEDALARHLRMVVFGDPGSGKTTLLRYLALCYARDRAEGRTFVRDNLGLPESGCLPILLPVRNLGAFLKERYPRDDGTEGHGRLLDFLGEYLRNERISLPGDFFDADLAAGRVAVLLDGMDEVGDASLRRRVARLIDSFAAAYPRCRIVVSSRIVGYSGPARLGEDFATTTVRDFALADVESFLRNWHRLVAVGQMGPGESAEVFASGQTAQLMDAIKANPRVRELAANPLMLTVIALVHRDRVRLPDRRAELYAEAVDVLLGKWDEAKGVEGTPILGDLTLDAGDRRLLLQGIALEMHNARKKEIERNQLRNQLLGEFAKRTADARAAERALDRFLTVIQERTGLLVEAGLGVYRFSHLTFQEYLAALAILARDDYVSYTLERVPESWWRETILLEVGQLSTQSLERTTGLINRISELKTEPSPFYNLVLAMEALRDAGSTRVDRTLANELQNRMRSVLERDRPVWSRLLGKLALKSWIEERGAFVEALVRAGSGYWSSPHGEPEWITVPAGEFWMDEREEARQVFVPEFRIARVPITNAQYQLFVQATKVAPPMHWVDGFPPKNKTSHPVVEVSWHEALAYCAWLSQVTGKSIRLPSEAEWEKAARGDKDRSEYPWGDDFDSAKCNSRKLGLRDTSPVGVFPTGASPYGCLDMAGNVLEWCQSKYEQYPYIAGDGREDLTGKGGRVVRGGSFLSGPWYVRCACRGSGRPGHRSVFMGFRVVVVSPGSRF